MAGLICEAIQRRLLLEFDYDGLHRVVQPYVHGRSTVGREVLRAIQVGGQSRSARITSGKLWSVEKLTGLRLSEQGFVPDDPNYNPNDTAMETIHCRIRR
jgi:hypothetical protein